MADLMLYDGNISPFLCLGEYIDVSYPSSMLDCDLFQHWNLTPVSYPLFIHVYTHNSMLRRICVILNLRGFYSF